MKRGNLVKHAGVWWVIVIVMSNSNSNLNGTSNSNLNSTSNSNINTNSIENHIIFMYFHCFLCIFVVFPYVALARVPVVPCLPQCAA